MSRNKNLERQKPSIGIIGNGFVGSAIANGFALHANVRIYDINPERSTHSFSETVNSSDVMFLSVPTPMKMKNGEIDQEMADYDY